MIHLIRALLIPVGLTLAVGCAATPAEEDAESSESNLSAFVCTSAETVKDVPNAPYGQVVATRAGAHAGFDRFVMEFKTGVPNYRVYRQASSTFYMDGSGDPVKLAGAAGIGITAQMASGWDMETGAPTFTGPRRFTPPGTTMLREAALTGDFEGQVNWGLGLERSACHRVFELANPPRLVVDVQKNGPVPTDPVPPPANPFTCEANEIVDSSADGGGTVAAVRASSNDGFDRFVLEFTPDSTVPNFTVRRTPTSVFSGPSGHSVTLAGTVGLDVSVHIASNPSASPRRFKPEGTSLLREAVQYEDFEGYVGWGLGLARTSCYRAFKLTNPPRLVVDVQK